MFPGSGATGIGAYLPSSGTNGDVLTVLNTAPSGMAWATPQSGVIINRSVLATQAILPPPNRQSTMVLVAEEPNASWNAEPDPGDISDTYQLEFQTPIVGAGTGGELVTIFGYITYVNNMRCVDLWGFLSGDIAFPIGLLYNDDYKEPAFVKIWQLPTGNGTGFLSNSFLLCGLFTGFHPADGSDLVLSNVIQINCANVVGSVVVPQKLQSNPPVEGFGFGNPPPPGSPLPYVSKFLVSGTTLYIFGYFNAIIDGGIPTGGLGSICLVDLVTGNFTNNLDTNNAGFGAWLSSAPSDDSGLITDALFTGTYLCITGQFSQLSIDNATRFGAPCETYAVLNTAIASGSNRWVNSPPDLVPAVGEGYCLQPSASISNTIFVISESGAPIVWNTTTPTTIARCGGTFPSGNYDTSSFNNVKGGSIDIGAGVANYDFVLYQDTVASPATSRVAYFTGGSTTVAGILNPDPTGMVPINNNTQVSNPFLGRSGYGVIYNSVVGPNPANIQVASTDAIFRYDPATVASLAFTLGPSPKGFIENGVVFNTATFTAPAGESQLYVASTSQQAWIQVGAKTAGLTYS